MSAGIASQNITGRWYLYENQSRLAFIALRFHTLAPKEAQLTHPWDCRRALSSLGTRSSLAGVSRNPLFVLSCICTGEKVFSKAPTLSFSVI